MIFTQIKRPKTRICFADTFTFTWVPKKKIILLIIHFWKYDEFNLYDDIWWTDEHRSKNQYQYSWESFHVIFYFYVSFCSSVNSTYHSWNSSQANINHANPPTLPGFTANVCDIDLSYKLRVDYYLVRTRYCVIANFFRCSQVYRPISLLNLWQFYKSHPKEHIS